MADGGTWWHLVADVERALWACFYDDFVDFDAILWHLSGKAPSMADW
jgi:hypothetical protein